MIDFVWRLRSIGDTLHLPLVCEKARRYEKRNYLRPLLAVIEAIDYGDIKIPIWPFDVV